MHAFGIDYDPDNSYLHQALQQIDDISNEDVEMKAPLSEVAVFLVLDTNILLHHFDVLAQFVKDVEKQSLPVITILPGAVIYELDGQKNRKGLAWFARRATAWLLEKIRERRSVRGQAQEETCKSTGNWKIKEKDEIPNSDMFNDDLILDCALYFRRERFTVLCSADNNLCLAAQAQKLHTITPSRYESSREIAYCIYGNDVDLSQFEEHKKSYKIAARDTTDTTDTTITLANDTTNTTITAAQEDVSMAVDAGPTDWKSEHPINMLHEAVVDHFSRLLVDLVGTVGGDEVRQRSTPGKKDNISQHAGPRRPYTEWSLKEIVDYLVRYAPAVVTLHNPRPEVFLQKAYQKGVRGARPGREWTRKDWSVAVNNLEAISRGWKEASIRESLAALEPHLEHVFALPLRA